MNQGFSEHHVLKTLQRLNSIYLLCVIIVTGLASAFFLVETRNHTHERSISRLTQLLGEEQAYLVRVALATHRLIATPMADRVASPDIYELEAAIVGLEGVHPQLKAGAAAGRLPYHEARDVLLSRPYHVDRHVQSLIARSRAVLEATRKGNDAEASEWLHEISEGELGLISIGLRELHSRLVAGAVSESNRSHVTVIGVVIAILGIVFLISFLVFRPLVDSLRQQVRMLGRQREKAQLAERRSRRAKHDADRANQAKTRFVANVSHDLRTPLNAILGFSGMLTFSKVAESERVEYASAIQRNGHQLLELVDDLLDLSRMEAGEYRLSRQPVSVAPLVNDVVRLFQKCAAEKNLQLNVVDRLDPGESAVMTDPTRLKQILTNLVGNAVKFTERGEVRIEVFSARSGSEVTSRAAFRIVDTGAGIPRDQRNRLFEPFDRLDSAASRLATGSGLGLAISKRLANALGGDVVLEASEDGRGSSFLLTIDAGTPCEAAVALLKREEAPLGAVRSPVHSGSTHVATRPRVLLIEDSEDNQILFSRFLEMEGIEVEALSGGDGAVEQVMSGAYDLVLLDIQIPGKNGYEVVSELRRRCYTKPVVALTAFAMEEERMRCMNAGCDAFLTKPIDRRAFVECVFTFIQHGPVPIAEPAARG